MKIAEAVQLYNSTLSDIRMGNLNVDDRYKVMKIVRAFKKAAEDFQSFVADTREHIKDQKELDEVCGKEYMREIELEYDRLGEEAFKGLLSVNDWTGLQAVVIEDLIK